MPQTRQYEVYRDGRRIHQEAYEVPDDLVRRDEAAGVLRGSRPAIRQARQALASDLQEVDADIAANTGALTLAQLRQHVERAQRRQKRILQALVAALGRERAALLVHGDDGDDGQD